MEANELRQLLQETEARLREYIDERAAKSEDRVREYIDERTHDVETRIVRAFGSYQQS